MCLWTGKHTRSGRWSSGFACRSRRLSKHLGVLREVGIVSASKHGRLRLYRLNARELKPVHDWVKTYESLWTHQLAGIKERAERKVVERSAHKRRRAKDKEAG